MLAVCFVVLRIRLMPVRIGRILAVILKFEVLLHILRQPLRELALTERIQMADVVVIGPRVDAELRDGFKRGEIEQRK